jgi:pilus assembly protein TadC
MKWFINFTESIGDSLIPKGLRHYIANYLSRAGISQVPYFQFGIFFYIGIIISLLIISFLFNLHIFSNINFELRIVIFLFILPFILSTVLSIFIIIFKLILDAKIFHKVKQMEAHFPEFLAEVSLNLKAGLTLENAIEDSVELEFGCLREEIHNISRRVKLGVELDVAIKEFCEMYDSDIISESFDLILHSWNKGAKTPLMMDRIIQNIKEVRHLKQKVVASVESYRIFLLTVTLFITPAMFALSYHLINLVRSILDRISLSTSHATLPITINPVAVNDMHYITFSVLAVGLIAGSCAVIISIIRTGDVKDSYRSIFTYVFSSIISYNVFLFLFSLFFSWFRV